MRSLMEECCCTSMRSVWKSICTHSFYISSTDIFLLLTQLFQSEECISFDAKQKVAIGLLQPAPAVFYDYYEPGKFIIWHFPLYLFGMVQWACSTWTILPLLVDIKCTVFYSAPQRSKMVSRLCSEDVCQCAESRLLFFRPEYKCWSESVN